MKKIINFLVPAFFLFVGAAMVIAGIRNEELSEIMQKAVMICLECIGFG
ncbi:MAG: hypothetical protein FWD13_05440 [Treponema sp.]|nr:hypothetical protein [Treponema sp.]